MNTNNFSGVIPILSTPFDEKGLISFDDLKIAYLEQARGLLDGGVDLFLVETVFDTLNSKAALYAIRELLDEKNIDIPVFVSGTVTDASTVTVQ